MDIRITPSRLSGTLDAVSSKAFVHRLLICSALAEKETSINFNGMSDDIAATIRCLEAMGSSIKTERTALIVTPIMEKRESSVILQCGESGSTARFVLPLAAHFFDSFTLTGEGRLPRRPFAPLCDALTNVGCKFDSDQLPMTVTGRIKSGNFQIAGNISSQFISGLLFVLPLLGEGSTITVTTPLESEGYVEMTIEVLSLFGIAVEKKDSSPPPQDSSENLDGSPPDPVMESHVFRINGNRRYDSPGFATAESDWSNAAFFLCMGALGHLHRGGDISLRGLSMISEQGDKKIIEILNSFGAKAEGGTLTTARPGVLRGINIDAAHIPDLVPTLSVIAAVSEGTTRIFNAQRLRLKESDRIHSTYHMLSSLGADVHTTDDGLVIRGKRKLQGGIVDGAGDHRIVMAAATAACACEKPVVIKGFGAVNKSYPSFFGNLKTLGGVIDVV